MYCNVSSRHGGRVMTAMLNMMRLLTSVSSSVAINAEPVQSKTPGKDSESLHVTSVIDRKEFR